MQRPGSEYQPSGPGTGGGDGDMDKDMAGDGGQARALPACHALSLRPEGHGQAREWAGDWRVTRGAARTGQQYTRGGAESRV